MKAPADTGGALVYAVGDVHGCYGPLKALLARIAGDAASRAGERTAKLIFLGDYIDRGAEPHRVLDALIWLRRRGELDVMLLKGNHEQALLDFLEKPEEGAGWLAYGGRETLLAYGVRPPGSEAEPAVMRRARDELLAGMPASHLRLLERLEVMTLVGGYAFVHAGVRPGVPLSRQKEADLLWIRRPFLDAPGPFEKVIVHGHSWRSERPQVEPFRIGLDTGCYETGVLTAARLDGAEIEILTSQGVLAPEERAAETA
jgi:serine/threonine protein phosphatase 1